jgi:hypothetical protein
MGQGLRAWILFALTVLPVAACAAENNKLSQKEISEGWILLFDGETDFGWRPRGNANWSVKDGTIVGQGAQGAAGVLATTSEFGDFELSIEVLMDETSNSGIFFRAPKEGDISPENAYEINIHDSHPEFPTGSLHGLKRTTGKAKSVGKWTRIQVRATGEDLRVAVGGIRSARARDQKFSRGTIALQFAGLGPSGTISFRNIKLKPMSLQSIFNGKDLTGWKVIPDHKSVFSVTPKGWINVKDGNGELQSEAQWADFVLQMDIISNGTHLNSGIFFRELPGQFWSGYESQIRNQWQGDDRTKPVDYGTGGIYNRQPARKVVSTDKKWFTKTIVAAGNHLAVWVDGYQVSDFTDTRPPNDNARQGFKAGAGVLGIQGHDPTTDLSFRRIRIKELPAQRTSR